MLKEELGWLRRKGSFLKIKEKTKRRSASKKVIIQKLGVAIIIQMKKPLKINSRIAYENKYISVKVDTLKLGSITWEQVYFVKPNEDSVGVIAHSKEGIYLQKEYRYACDDYFWQIVLGTIDKGDNKLNAARNELKEEIGVTAGKFQQIGSIIPDSGLSSQKMHVFVAEDLTLGERQLEDKEVSIEVKQFSLKEMDEMVINGEITCGFTLSALYLFKLNFLDKKTRYPQT